MTTESQRTSIGVFKDGTPQAIRVRCLNTWEKQGIARDRRSWDELGSGQLEWFGIAVVVNEMAKEQTDIVRLEWQHSYLTEETHTTIRFLIVAFSIFVILAFVLGVAVGWQFL